MSNLTADYGLDVSSQAFPGLTQAKLDSAGMYYLVINSGAINETLSGCVARIVWILSKPVVIFILNPRPMTHLAAFQLKP